jgi:biotin transport system substrate-specific component
MTLPASDASSALIDRRRGVLADLVPGDSRALVRDATLVLASAAFVGVLAQIVVHLPFTPIPVTGQTLGVVLAGCALGWRRAGISMALYLLIGLAGVPWFAGHTSGWQNADGGYLIGFIAAATVCGYLAERGWDRSILGSVPIMIVGELVLYAIAVPWLAAAVHVGFAKALSLGFRPFIVGDAVKLALAAGLLPASWRLVERGAPRP